MELGPEGSWQQELCPVCGDRVSGFHYGLLTCESCKGFFKRTVQNGKSYACAENQSCTIDKALRKRCPSCRFQKCLHVGMQLEAVRADRVRGGRNKLGPAYRRYRALREQRAAQARGPRPGLYSAPCLPQWDQRQARSSETRDAPAGLVQTPTAVTWTGAGSDPAVVDSGSSSSSSCGGGAFRQLCAAVELLLHGAVEWARSAAFFRQLQVADQMKLLHHCWSELLVLDVVSRRVLYGGEAGLLQASLPEDPAALTLLTHRGQELTQKLLLLGVDRQEFVCIKYLLLFDPAAPELLEPDFIRGVRQQVEAALLDQAGSPLLPERPAQLLATLPELRSLAAQAERYLLLGRLRGAPSCSSLLDEMLQAGHGGACGGHL